MIDILTAMQDPELFGPTFKRRLLRGDTWASWKVFLTALFGLAMDAQAKEMYQRHTGRMDEPAEQFREAFVIVGRRGGKSLIAALVAVFLACFRSYDDALAAGEVGTVMILGADRRQCRVILSYIDALLSIPMLSRMVVSRLKESIELNNRIRIEIHTSSFRAVRGYTIVAAILDEVAFWRDETSANPDSETLIALRPAMATVSSPLLLAISSPYAKRGALWEAYRENFGKPSDVLVWKASSREMNSTLNPAVVAAAFLRDSSSARAEYGGEFRDDIESFISIETIEACVITGRHELPFSSTHSYTAFVDPSGGRSDSFSMAIAHMEGCSKAVLDLIREVVPPFSPEQVVGEFGDTLKRYHLTEVTGDKYAGEWPREQFRKHGIEYRVAGKSRSELYLEMLPVVTSGQSELLDHRKLTTQLVGLERRVGRSGKDSIDHAPGSHDDVANVAAGAIVLALGGAAEHTYGLLDIFARFKKHELVVERGAIIEAVKQERTRSVWDEPDHGTCPNCPGYRLQRIGGCGLRCSQCGYTDTSQLPKVARASTRADILARTDWRDSFRRRFR